MKKILVIALAVMAIMPASAQRTLSLQDCRQLALENNKQIKMSKLQADMAQNIHKAAKTKYLPHVDGLGGYQHFTKEISLLNSEQKTAFNNLGTTATGTLTNQMSGIINGLVSQGFLTQDAAQLLAQQISGVAGTAETTGNNIGRSITDALRSNT